MDYDKALLHGISANNLERYRRNRTNWLLVCQRITYKLVVVIYKTQATGTTTSIYLTSSTTTFSMYITIVWQTVTHSLYYRLCSTVGRRKPSWLALLRHWLQRTWIFDPVPVSLLCASDLPTMLYKCFDWLTVVQVQTKTFNDSTLLLKHKPMTMSQISPGSQEPKKNWEMSNTEGHKKHSKTLTNNKQKCCTSLNKSPVHLATIRTIINGRPRLMFPVASTKITVKLRVIRTIPPTQQSSSITLIGYAKALNQRVKNQEFTSVLLNWTRRHCTIQNASQMNFTHDLLLIITKELIKVTLS